MADPNSNTPNKKGFAQLRNTLPLSPLSSTVASPLTPPPPPLLRTVSSGGSIYFGVVGEGRSKKILGFGSFGSVSEGSSYTPWICSDCKYENADSSNRVCSMCGLRKLPSTASWNSAAASTTMLEDDESTNYTRSAGLLRQLSSHSTLSFRMPRAKRLESFPDEELSVEALVSDGVVSDTDGLVTDLARLTVEETGGWTCPDCTFVNTKELHLTCDVCGQKKPPSRQMDPSLMLQSSLDEFLTQSMAHEGERLCIDPQIEALLKFEEMANEKAYAESLMDEQREVLNDASSRVTKEELTELRGILEEGQATLKALEVFLAGELKEYHSMLNLQDIRADEIERIEGKSPREALTNSATKPGAHRISTRVLGWHGQQRMLDDWKVQLQIRKQDIEQLRTQQEQALSRLLK